MARRAREQLNNNPNPDSRVWRTCEQFNPNPNPNPSPNPSPNPNPNPNLALTLTPTRLRCDAQKAN